MQGDLAALQHAFEDELHAYHIRGWKLCLVAVRAGEDGSQAVERRERLDGVGGVEFPLHTVWRGVGTIVNVNAEVVPVQTLGDSDRAAVALHRALALMGCKVAGMVD